MLRAAGEQLIVGPGSQGGLELGLRMRLYRGTTPASGDPWIGEVEVTRLESRYAQVRVVSGSGQVGDLALSDPRPLPVALRLPPAEVVAPPRPAAATVTSIDVNLFALVEPAGTQTVSFAVPFPPGCVDDEQQLRVVRGDQELPTSGRVLARWAHTEAPQSARAVLVQFEVDFADEAFTKVSVHWDRPRTRPGPPLVSVADLVERHEEDGLVYEDPRVLAVLPPEWLAASWVAGPLVAATENPWLPEFDAHQVRLFFGFEVRDASGSLIARVGPDQEHLSQDEANLSLDSAEHQLDRTLALYRMYCRMGDPAVALAAYQHATFYRHYVCTAERSPRGRGSWLLRDPHPEQGWLDVKYAYAEGPAIHYLLTGDERFLAAIADVMALWNSEFGDFLFVDYTQQPHNWTERYAGLGWASRLAAYEVTGDDAYLDEARRLLETVWNMQFAPTDGHPPDGSWRHSSAHHLEGGDTLGTSVWMSAMLVDAIFHHWCLTADPRCAHMLAAYAEFTERYGITWHAWRDDEPRWPLPWYFASAITRGWLDTGGERDHSLETGHVLLLGYYVRRDLRYLWWANLLMRHTPWRVHPRMFNWMYRSSPQAIWLLKAADVQPPLLEALLPPWFDPG